MEYYEQLYTHKFNCLVEIVKFSERYNLPKLTEEEIDKLSISKSIQEIVFILQISPTKQGADLDGFIGEFSSTDQYISFS